MNIARKKGDAVVQNMSEIIARKKEDTVVQSISEIVSPTPVKRGLNVAPRRTIDEEALAEIASLQALKVLRKPNRQLRSTYIE